MSTIEPTAYTVKDPGNGRKRRYGGKDWKEDITRAERKWHALVEVYPMLTRSIVPDHFIQEYCQRCDAASWSGSYGPGDEAPVEIMLKLLEVAAAHGDLNFVNGKM
jgi:hypothetical protein